jgi:hypothetical protein
MRSPRVHLQIQEKHHRYNKIRQYARNTFTWLEITPLMDDVNPLDIHILYSGMFLSTNVNVLIDNDLIL